MTLTKDVSLDDDGALLDLTSPAGDIGDDDAAAALTPLTPAFADGDDDDDDNDAAVASLTVDEPGVWTAEGEEEDERYAGDSLVDDVIPPDGATPRSPAAAAAIAAAGATAGEGAHSSR